MERGAEYSRAASRPAQVGGLRDRRPSAYTQVTVSTYRAEHPEDQHLELPVEELLRRARPLPPHGDMMIEDLTHEEGLAFLVAVDS